MHCAKLNQVDVEYLKDQPKTWQCSECTKAKSRLRSHSSSSKSALALSQPVPGDVAISQDQISRLFSELASMRTAFDTVADDIAQIRTAQCSLDVRFGQIQDTLSGLGNRLDDHARQISQHSTDISDIQLRISKVETVVDGVVASGSGGAGASTSTSDPHLVAKLAAELDDRQKRQRCMVVFGVAESQATAGASRQQADRRYVADMFQYLGLASEISGIFRLGKKSTGSQKVRPIKVIMGSSDEVHNLIKSAGRLQVAERYKHVSLSYDRTPQQQAEYRALKEELRARVENGERDLKIKYIRGSPRIVATKSLNSKSPAEQSAASTIKM